MFSRITLKNYLLFVFILSFFFVGLYYEGFCAIISIALFLVLFYLKQQNELFLQINISTVLIALTFVLYLISPIWAVDRGISIWGAVRFLPILLFVIVLTNSQSETKKLLLSSIPFIGCVMTVTTFILWFIPMFKDSFNINGRLGGFFQYPNTFACFLLIGIIVLVLEKKECEKQYLYPLILATLTFGVFLAASRSVLILSAPFILACFIFVKDKKKILMSLLIFVVSATIGIGVARVIGSAATGHITAIASNSSTFWGRLLYWKDALPIIAKHPFGLGYLGYFMMQGSFQSGVYSVRWVHNDLLQLALDVGWIPAILGIAAVIKSIISKNTSVIQKLVLLFLVAHACFDFDLQFISMYFVLVLCLDIDSGNRIKEGLSKIETYSVYTILSMFSIYIGVVSFFTYNGMNHIASSIYKWNTLSDIGILEDETKLDKAADIARKITSQNSYAQSAWMVLAQEAYSQSDFENVIQYGYKALSTGMYNILSYSIYFDMLKDGLNTGLYEDDKNKVRMCFFEITSLRDKLYALEAKESSLTDRLPDRPDYSLLIEINDYIEETKAYI